MLCANTSGRLENTSASWSGSALKSGASISTPVPGFSSWICRIVSAYSQAPPSSRSSRATPVTVAYRRSMVRTDSATRRGSSRSSCSDFTRCCSLVYSGPILARVLIHSGLRSIGVSALRTSSRRSLRPSGAIVTAPRVRGAPRRAKRPHVGLRPPPNIRSSVASGDGCGKPAHAYYGMHYHVAMSVDRITMAMDPELSAAVREAAKRSGMSVSGWLAQAAADRLRNELLGIALDKWQEETGPLTEEELRAAAETLGLRHDSKGNAA